MQSILSSVRKTIFIKYCITFNFSPQNKSEIRIYKGNSLFALVLGHVIGVLRKDHKSFCFMWSPTNLHVAPTILHKTISFPENDVCFKVV